MYNANGAFDFFDPQDIRENKFVSGISYFWILFFIPFILCPRSKFARFHANQALLLFIASCVGRFVLGMIPFIGGFANWIYGIVVLVVAIGGFLNAFSGHARELPYIGHIRLFR